MSRLRLDTPVVTAAGDTNTPLNIAFLKPRSVLFSGNASKRSPLRHEVWQLHTSGCWLAIQITTYNIESQQYRFCAGSLIVGEGMGEMKMYIVEIPQVLGDETTIYLEANGSAVESLFAIVEISDGGASIVDNCYRTINEAQNAWPEAIVPKPYHLASSAIEHNCTIVGRIPNPKFTPR